MTEPASPDYSTQQGMLDAAAAVDHKLPRAMDAFIAQSKPGRKCKAWWTLEIGRYNEVLATTRRAYLADKGHLELCNKEKEATTQWRTAIRRAQWAYWEAKFQSGDRNMTFQVI